MDFEFRANVGFTTIDSTSRLIFFTFIGYQNNRLLNLDGKLRS